MARGLKSSGAWSAAAKRYCCAKDEANPTTSSPAANSQKLPRNTAKAAMVPPSAVIDAPPMKPSLRPTARMSSAAGTAPSATPIL